MIEQTEQLLSPSLAILKTADCAIKADYPNLGNFLHMHNQCNPGPVLEMGHRLVLL